MAVDTLYRPQAGGGGTGTSDYIKDVFLDVSRQATDNTGLTSSASTNPLSEYFGNSDAAQYGIKTLFVKGLREISDKSKWINSKPTYEVIFTESFPAVKAYAYGNVRMLDLQTGFATLLGDVDDAFGVVGNIRQVAWIVDTSPSTGTVTPYLDSVSSSALTFGSAAVDATQKGVNNFNLLLQNSSAASNDLHDFRIEADQSGIARVVGLVCYFENATSNINQRPGSTYVNKVLSTTSSVTAIALPAVSGRLGADTLLHKNAAQTYSLNTLEPTSLQTVGVGDVDTNLIDVTTGQGASFPTGTLFGAIASGTSFYFGIVQSQSTDTLTVGPTLGFGLSGPLYKYGYAGSTFAISASMYAPSVTIDPERVDSVVNPQGFGATMGTLFYQDPESKFRLWGTNLFVSNFEGLPGFQFAGASGFLQIDGKFAALDFEHMSSGILHATFAINGLNCFGINAGYSGVFKKSILTDSGPGWNSVVITPGASFNPALNTFTKFTLYDLANQGVSAGLLGEFPTYVNAIPRAAENATLMQMGSMERHYADELYLTGAWTRAVGASFAGGVGYYGASTNSTLKFQYYGTDFAFVGTAGASMTATLDGASIAFNFNVMKSVTTLGWHTVNLAYNAGSTATIEAVSVRKPQTGELKSLQNYNSDERFEKIPTVYSQSQTPGSAKDGDFWFQQSPLPGVAPFCYVKAFGLWMQIPITVFSDDPNFDQFFTAGGLDTGGAQLSVVQQFSGSSWSLSTSLPQITDSAGRSSCQYNGKFYMIGGARAAAVSTATTSFNRVAWLAETAVTAARYAPGSHYGFGLRWVNQGNTDGDSATSQNTAYAYNGSTWATKTAWSVQRYSTTCFLVSDILYSLGGLDTSNNASAVVNTRTAADAVATGTVAPVTMGTSSGGNVNTTLGLAAQGTGGATSNASYTWNGAAWSASITVPYTADTSAGAASISRYACLIAGGNNSGSLSNNAIYNGFSYASQGALNTAVRRHSAAAI